MTTITIASGKGGAGKTSLTAALAACIGPACIVADCDVDAANTAIAMGAKLVRSEEYHAGPGYRIDVELCRNCGKCASACRFNAIVSFSALSKGKMIVPELCERCGACMDVCPRSAIFEFAKVAGMLYQSSTALGNPLVHAELEPGEDTSGKLVRKVREKARSLADQSSVILIDAPPGIGCPVIAALSGSDLSVVLVEASVSGINDARRLIALNIRSSRPMIGIINKTGLDPTIDQRARELASEFGIPLAGEIPFDRKLRFLESNGRTWLEAEGSTGAGIKKTLQNVAAYAENLIVSEGKEGKT
jgi:MinD superfamily P-loop ATPase